MRVAISKKNEVYLRISAPPHINYELSDYFTFDVPNAKYLRSQRKYKWWDGKIKLYSPGTGELYVGLFPYLIEWLQQNDYEYEVKDSKYYGLPVQETDNVNHLAIKGFLRTLNLKHQARDYQVDAIFQAIKYQRRLILSPTASGKSMMIYGLIRWHMRYDRQILLIVPTTSLVEQMYKDFEEYGWQASTYCHKIYGGKDRYDQTKPVVISTWQSIHKESREWFDRFDVVIGDEAHNFQAKSLTNILTKMHQCKHRIGFTGTLSGAKTHQLVLEGLFGKVNKVTKTSDLQRAGYLSKLRIKVIVLRHASQKFENFQEEMDYIVEHDQRNRFIKNLAKDLPGNTLILFNLVEKHGDPLFELINSSITDRPVHYVTGEVDVEERERIRELTETTERSLIVASYGTFSTGINIKNLHNVIFASPSKSKIRNLQSIGRVLRKGENKTTATLYDIADDISGNHYRNYTLNHMIERIKIYNEEDFDYEIIEVKLKDKND